MLTANVFTAFRYLPAESGIIGFLRSVKGVGDILPRPTSRAEARFFFWPLGQTREPDVLLELRVNDTLYHVVIEAKYHSCPSDRDIEEIDGEEETFLWGNQLADQLRELARGEYTVWKKGRRNRTNRLLIYLTAHPARPRNELQTSAALYPEGASRLFWTSWYQVSDYLQRQAGEFRQFPFDHIVSDILTLLELKQFTTFQGIRPLPALSVGADSGCFWTGRDTLLPVFEGIRKPPRLSLPVQGGGFWRD
ncbi:MAG TPA: hypothetical protein VK879_10535 [Candidatus Sulfomarinibacteraceae bacterium]|nr:hypothetical protein [Candidatus Sulfomarinibacteraceae bacterium]